MANLQPCRPLAQLPNLDNFRFRGWLRDGTQRPCIVERQIDGTHVVTEEKTGIRCIGDLCGWSEST